MHKEDTQVLVRALATFTLGGHALPMIEYCGQPLMFARNVAESLGYEEPDRLGTFISGKWAPRFREGTDYVRLSGEVLAEVKAVDSGPNQPAVVEPNARYAILLTESGAQLAAMLSRTEEGRKFRRWVVDVAIPALHTQMTLARADASMNQYILGRSQRPVSEYVELWRAARDLRRAEVAAADATIKASHARAKVERMEAQRLLVELNQKERRALQAGLLRAMQAEIEDWRCGKRQVRTVRGLAERVDTVILDEKACRGATPYLLRDTERRYN